MRLKTDGVLLGELDDTLNFLIEIDVNKLYFRRLTRKKLFLDITRFVLSHPL